MEKVSEKEQSGGKVEIMEDLKKHLFLAKPHGIINPTLVKEDLKRAQEFSQICEDHWTYVTNTEDVRLVNPFNLFYLKEVKKLQKLRAIVVFAPGFINRLLIRLAAPIVRPDRIIKSRHEFDYFIEHVS